MKIAVQVAFFPFDKRRPPEEGYYLARYHHERLDVATVVAAEWDGRRWITWSPDQPKGAVTHYAAMPRGGAVA